MARLARPDLSLAEAAWLLAAAFLALFVSALGILAAALGAMYAYYESRRGLLAVYVVLAAIAAGIELVRLV